MPQVSALRRSEATGAGEAGPAASPAQEAGRDRLAVALRWLNRAERVAMGAALLGMAGTLLVVVLGRETFGVGIFGADQFATWLMMWAAFLGFGVAAADGAHIRPRFADRWLPEPWRPAAERAGRWVSALILAVLTGAAIAFVHDSWIYGERGTVLDWATWPIQAAMPLGFGLTAIRAVVWAIRPDLAPEEKAPAA